MSYQMLHSDIDIEVCVIDCHENKRFILERD